MFIQNICERYINRIVFLIIIPASIFSGCNSALQNAIHTNDYYKVKTLVADGSKVNKNLDNKLIIALRLDIDNCYIIKLLVENGADVNAAPKDGFTPLIKTAYYGHFDIAKLLVENGANVNAASKWDGFTPLTNAAYNGHFDVVKLLLENGANVNAATEDGFTPLINASYYGSPELTIYLYEQGADIDFKDSSIVFIVAKGTLHHALGDHFLAQGKLERAKAHFEKTRDYYDMLVDEFSGEITKLKWKEFALIARDVILISIASVGQDYLAQQQSRQNAEISALVSAQKTGSGYQGYYNYMSKWKKNYVPTYQAVDAASFYRPTGYESIEERKEYAKSQVKHNEDQSVLIDKVLKCFDEFPNELDLQECIRGLTHQE